MAKIEFKVNVDPKLAINLVKEYAYADLVEKDLKELGDEKCIGILVFEKYYMRVKSTASLVVIIDNLNGDTNIKAISSGAAAGDLFRFDMGAAENFVNSIKEIFIGYII